MKHELENLINKALSDLGIEPRKFVVEHPAEIELGDYSTNVGIVTKRGEEIKEYLDNNKPESIERIEVKNGFINFYLSREFFHQSLKNIIDKGEKFGRSKDLKGQRIIVEHTNPNPFKNFHVGHLMPNVIGSAIARMLEWNGAEVKQANYQGDVGMHVAKVIWGYINFKLPISDFQDAYVKGNEVYESDENAKREIQEINKKIYERTDENINKLYDDGRKESLEYFERIYKKLGTKFDYYFFESETAPVGHKIVEENIGKVFEESDGAIVYKGSHTRVFINSQGLPTYEAKELGLAKLKHDKYAYDRSIVVTGNDIKEYFRVLLEAMGHIFPELAEKTLHISHGMMRLPTGKMSSRTGDVVPAEDLVEEVKKKTEGNEEVAIGAIKYMVLRQSIGSDITFDLEKSVSTEGDSGVYLQYAHARACSVLEKAGGKAEVSKDTGEIRSIEKLLYRFPEIVERAGAEYAPNQITTYLTELAGAFNNFYAHEQVISDDPESSYRLAIVQAFRTVMRNGLTMLGIPTPERI